MASKILVENTEARVISLGGLPLKPGTPHPDALLPGVNEVDASAWAEALKIATVKHMVAAGVLKPEKTAPVDLSELKAPEAVELVKRTVDRSLLEKWFDTEKRKAVLEALDAQLEAITPKTEDDEKE